ncbi:MAG: 4-hydroxy-tetrahydrodipicolinate synthase [Cyclobacteriaceae bacterium]|nr:4-hydroxy-tetrahydrodipicolinate synthase [Cyclobacteriaceae bacterium]
MKKLEGTGVALVTPFNKKKEIDFQGLENLLIHTAKGVDYYVVMGTTGESATLSHDEKLAVLDFVKQHNPKKLPIVYGIGGNNTQQVVDSIKEAPLKGVDALLSVSPYYNKPSQEGIYQHFKAIAAASPLPIVLYNVPGRTASNITAATTLRLAALQKIVAVKEASGNLEQCMNIASHKPKDFSLISGDDLLTSSFYAMGGAGVISVLANAFPLIFKSIRTYSAKGDFKKSALEQFKLLDINGPMYEEGNPVGVKLVLRELGVCEEYTRLPLTTASRSLQKRIISLTKPFLTKKG